MLLPSEIEAQTAILQEAQESKGGYVGIPDQIFSKNLLIEATQVDDFVREWRSKYDFHLSEFQIVINAKPQYRPKCVNIQCTLNPWDPPLQRPCVTHIFPSTEFVDPNWKVSGDFGVSASLGFNKLPDLMKKFSEGGFEGEAKVEFSYIPRIARVDSGTSGSNFHWNFRSASGEAPQGGIDLKVVIMRPRIVEQMKIFFELGVFFDRRRIPLILNDSARVAGESTIQFNPSPI